MTGRKRRLAVFLVLLAIPLLCLAVEDATAGDTCKNLDGVLRLFDLIDTIVDQNPHFAAVQERCSSLDAAAAAAVFDSLAAVNRNNPEIAAKIDALFATETYQVYFRRFRNVTPDVFREAFINLPWRTISTPGDVSRSFFELCLARVAVRAWTVDVLQRIESARCREKALQWLPAGDYDPVVIYFIYDSNAGSYTAEGKPFFNLHSAIGEVSPGGSLALQLASVDIDAIESVIAHELQHIYARPVLYPPGLFFPSWQGTWLNRIIRGIVSEGVAGQCNPVSGFKQELWEDPEVLTHLIQELNRICIGLSQGTISETEIEQWYKATYHESARELLRSFLKRRYGSDESDRLLWKYVRVRPDLVHTLGWWMVSRISEHQAMPERAVTLLEDPLSLFTRYNLTLEDKTSPLLIDERAVALLQSFQDLKIDR